jgi:hypothetical protein
MLTELIVEAISAVATLSSLPDSATASSIARTPTISSAAARDCPSVS